MTVIPKLSEDRAPDGDRDWERTLRATLNVLEDFQEERTSARSSTQAVLNILDDLEEDRRHAAQGNAALLNILDDFNSERTFS